MLIFLIDLTYILHLPKFSYSTNGPNILKAIPVVHWILLIFSSSLLVASLNLNRRDKWPSVIIGLMYGALFYITNLYFMIPYEQVENTFPSSIIEFLLSSGRITREALSVHSLSYLSYPISFILEISMMLIGGIGKISIYTVGLSVFLGAFYVGLILYYYYKKGRDIKFAVLSLATYIVLSFYVINDQVAPQTLALAFLPYLYRLTFDYREGEQPLKVLALILILWFALVFTHPFMFLFYILPVLGVVVYNRVILKQQGIKDSTIGIMVSIWGFGFVYLFYNLLSIPLRVFVEQWGEARGETWWVFANFFRKSGAFGPIKYTPHPHYELVPKWMVETQAWILRIMLILLVGIILYSFILELKRAITSGKLSHQLVFDVSVMVSSGILFVIGLMTTFLGQRVFQVAFIPLSRYIPNFKAKKAIRCILMVILIMAPVAYTFNSLTNLTVGPQLFVEDKHLIVAGYFGNTYLPPHSKVVVARELYPSEYPTHIQKFSYPLGIVKWRNLKWNYLYYSTKFRHGAQYYGLGYYSDKNYTISVYSCVYTNNISMVMYEMYDE